ncbi:MAG: hypothetical protein IPH06_02435 [Alphaproteobacteria bacterium]|nr:hypothetical protein [Alphaproteobacteria bacterium]QQS56908.1 MAG: hypothetical protein IPN28_11690 [Alphaproteobacteria bacterium]
MKDAFKQQATSLYLQLRDLSADGDWRFDLERAFSARQFNAPQLQAIGAAATPTCLSNITDGKGRTVPLSLSYNLTHAFTDPVRNSAQSIQILGDDLIDVKADFSLGVLVRARYALRDIVQNYPLLLGKEMPPSVGEIITTYRTEVLPQVDGLIDDLARKTGIDPGTIAEAQHWQHLRALPPEVF